MIEPWDIEVEQHLTDEANARHSAEHESYREFLERAEAEDQLQQLLAQEHARQEEILRRSDATQRQQLNLGGGC